MLPIPTDANCIVSVVGIDPGSETLGIAVISFNFVTFEIVSTEAYTFIGSKLPGSEWVGSLFNDRTKRITAHRDNLLRILYRVNPICIAAESAFMNMRRPQAYGALVEVMSALREAVRMFDVWRNIQLIDPPTVKRSVGAPGNALKDVVKMHLLKLTELTSVCTTDVNLLDEHSIDALACAYAQYVMCKESRFQSLI